MEVTKAMHNVFPGVYHLEDRMGVHMTLLTGQNSAVLFDTGYGIDDVAAMVREITPGVPITICQHEPFSGSHVGPGMLGLFFRGVER